MLNPEQLANMSDEEFDAFIISLSANKPQRQQPQVPTIQPLQPQVDKTGFVKGNLQKSWGNFGQMAGGALGLFGDLVGSDSIKDYGLGAAEGAQMYVQDVDQQMATPATDVIGTYEREGLWEAAKEVPQFLAEQAIQTAPLMVMTGGTGGFVGKTVVKSALTKALVRRGLMKEASTLGVEAAARKHLSQELVDSIVKKGTLAATGASGAQWAGLSSGGIYAEQEVKDPLRALGYGSLTGLTVPIPEAAAIMRSGLGKKILVGGAEAIGDTKTTVDLLKGIGKEAVKQMPLEAGQEVVQTGLEQLGKDQDPFSEEARKEQILSGIAGAGIGGVFGGGTKAVSGGIDLLRKPAIQDNKTAIDVLEAEETDTLDIEEEVALRFGQEQAVQNKMVDLENYVVKDLPVETKQDPTTRVKDLVKKMDELGLIFNGGIDLPSSLNVMISELTDGKQWGELNYDEQQMVADTLVQKFEESEYGEPDRLNQAIDTADSDIKSGVFNLENLDALVALLPNAKGNIQYDIMHYIDEYKKLGDANVPSDRPVPADERFHQLDTIVNPDPNALAKNDIEMDVREILSERYPGLKWTDITEEERHSILDEVESLYSTPEQQELAAQNALFDLYDKAEAEIEGGNANEGTLNELLSAYKTASPEPYNEEGMTRKQEIQEIGKRYRAELNKRSEKEKTEKKEKEENVKGSLQISENPVKQNKYTPEKIESLEPHQIFVFGSNTEGRHGLGAAKIAKDKFGAIYGQAEGLQGQSYGFVTKDLSKGKQSVSLQDISKGIDRLFAAAENNKTKEFLVTKIGTGLGGFSEAEIAELFSKKNIPENIVLPKEFSPVELDSIIIKQDGLPVSYYKKVFASVSSNEKDFAKLMEFSAQELGYDSVQEMIEDKAVPYNRRGGEQTKAKVIKKLLKWKQEQKSRLVPFTNEELEIQEFLSRKETLDKEEELKRNYEQDVKPLRKAEETEEEIATREAKQAFEEFDQAREGEFKSDDAAYDEAFGPKRPSRVEKEVIERDISDPFLYTQKLDEVVTRKTNQIIRRKPRASESSEQVKLQQKAKSEADVLIAKDTAKTISTLQKQLSKNKMLTEQEKQDVYETFSSFVDPELTEVAYFAPSLFEQLLKDEGIVSFEYLKAFPDMLIAEPDRPATNVSYPAGRGDTGKRYIEKKPAGKVISKETRQKAREASYEYFKTKTVPNADLDYENTSVVFDALAAFAEQGLQNEGKPFSAQEIVRRRGNNLKGKNDAERLESVQRILSRMRIRLPGEESFIEQTSDEWRGAYDKLLLDSGYQVFDKDGNRINHSDKYIFVKNDGSKIVVKQQDLKRINSIYAKDLATGKIKILSMATEYTISEAQEAGRELNRLSTDDAEYRTAVKNVDPVSEIVKGVDLISLDFIPRTVGGKPNPNSIFEVNNNKNTYEVTAIKDGKVVKRSVVSNAKLKDLWKKQAFKDGIKNGSINVKDLGSREALSFWQHPGKVQDTLDAGTKLGTLSKGERAAIGSTIAKMNKAKMDEDWQEKTKQETKLYRELAKVRADLAKRAFISPMFQDKEYFKKDAELFKHYNFSEAQLHEWAKDSDYDPARYASKINNAIEIRVQSKADAMFRKAKDKSLTKDQVQEFIFYEGEFTAEEKAHYNKLNTVVERGEVTVTTEANKEKSNPDVGPFTHKVIEPYINTLPYSVRKKLAIYKELEDQLMGVVKTPKLAQIKSDFVPKAAAPAMLFETKGADKTTDTERAVAEILKQQGVNVFVGKLRNPSTQSFFDQIAKVFGADLVVVNSLGGEKFQGKYMVGKSGKPVIVVNVQGSYSFERIFAHELFHHVVNKAGPAAYAKFKGALLDHVDERVWDEAIERARKTWMPKAVKHQVTEYIMSQYNTMPFKQSSSIPQASWKKVRQSDTPVAIGKSSVNYQDSSQWKKIQYEHGLDPDITPEQMVMLEEEVLAEVFSFAFQNKAFWSEMNKSEQGKSLARKLLTGILEFAQKIIDIFTKEWKYTPNGMFNLKALIKDANWMDDVESGTVPIKGAYSIIYELMGDALESESLDRIGFVGDRMLPTVESIKGKVLNGPYKDLFPKETKSYKDVMTAIENIVKAIGRWIVNHKPKGMFVDVGASDMAKTIGTAMAHGGNIQAARAAKAAIEPHENAFKGMTKKDLEILHDNVSRFGSKAALDKLPAAQREAFLAMETIATEAFTELKKIYPWLPERKHHFGQSIRWYKGGVLFDDEFEWLANGGRSKFEGNKRFLKEKSELTTAEIKEKFGLEYKTIDPHTLFIDYIRDTYHLVELHKQMDSAIDVGLVRFFTDASQARDAGYVPVDDNAFKVFQRMGYDKGYKIKMTDGTYYGKNGQDIYFTNQTEARHAADALRRYFEKNGQDSRISLEEVRPDTVRKVSHYAIYQVVNGKEFYITDAKTRDAANKSITDMDDPTGFEVREVYAEATSSVVSQMYFAPDFARMVNVLLSKDHLREFSAFGISGNKVMDLKNFVTSWELSLSLFHAFTIGQEMTASYAAWDHVRGQFSLKSYNPIQIIKESKELSALMTEMLVSGKVTPAAQAKANALLKTKDADVLDALRMFYYTGGMLGQDASLRHSGYDLGKVKYSKDGKKGAVGMAQGIASSVKEVWDKEVADFAADNPDSKLKFGAGNIYNMAKFGAQVTSQWLMEDGIPKLKMAQFAREYTMKVERHKQDIEAGIITKEQIAIDVMTFIEDRFGEVNWANMWLNKSYKTALQFAFRSFTWIQGTWAALGKSGSDVIKKGWFTLKGEKYEITEKGLWGIHVMAAHMATAGIISSAYMLMAGLSGGEQPTDEDTPWATRMMFPRVDPYDNTRRLSIPSYVTEFWKIASHLGAGGNEVELSKLVSGRFNSLLGAAVDVARNEDFRGVSIRNKEENVMYQAVDVVQRFLPLPISLSTVVKDAQKKGFEAPSLASGLLGFTGAPAAAMRSAATNTAFGISRKEYKGREVTEDKMEMKDELSRAMNAYSKGDKSKIDILLREGKVSMRQFEIALERLPLINNKPNPRYKAPLESALNRLTIEGALKVWPEMTDSEKAKYRHVIIKKYSNVMTRNEKPMEEKKKIREDMKELGILR